MRPLVIGAVAAVAAITLTACPPPPDPGTPGPSTTDAPTQSPTADALDFLRSNSLLRVNDAGLSLCEKSPTFSGRSAPSVWVTEVVPGPTTPGPAAGGDFFVICALTGREFNRGDVLLKTPSGASVVNVSLTVDRAQRIRTLHPVPDGFALVGATPGDRRLHYVGLTEPTHAPDDGNNWITQVTLLLVVNRPEGAWPLSFIGSGVQVRKSVQIMNHCNPSPPAGYPTSNPLVISPGTAVAPGQPVSPEANCRMMPQLIGADFATTKRAFEARAKYGEFTLRTATGNCGLLMEDGSSRDNRPGFVDETTPRAGWFYSPGEEIKLVRTIKCPPFPEEYFSLQTAPNGFPFWGVVPGLSFTDVAQQFNALKSTYPDWKWEAFPACGPGSIVSRFESVGGSAAFPGALIPHVLVSC